MRFIFAAIVAVALLLGSVLGLGFMATSREPVPRQTYDGAVTSSYVQELKDARLRERMVAVEKQNEAVIGVGKFIVGLLIAANGLLLGIVGCVWRTFRRTILLHHRSERQLSDVATLVLRLNETMERHEVRLNAHEDRIEALSIRFGQTAERIIGKATASDA